jgi:hypothetical protein
MKRVFFIRLSPNKGTSAYIANQAWRNSVLLALAPTVVPFSVIRHGV